MTWTNTWNSQGFTILSGKKWRLKIFKNLCLSLNDKKEYTVYKIGLKQVLYRGLILFGLT